MGTPAWRSASPKALANALPLSLRFRWAVMLSKLRGSVSALSGKVAPWRTTITSPPARRTWLIFLSSAAAGPIAANPAMVDKLKETASAVTVLLDIANIVGSLKNEGGRFRFSNGSRRLQSAVLVRGQPPLEVSQWKSKGF